ncbi:MAG: DMT family transporter [Granulosicoccus sp.]
MKNSPITGIALMVVATFIFASQDAITKSLTTQLPVAQIVFIRFCAFAIMALLIAHRDGGIRLALRSAVPLNQLVRCLLMCAEIALFAYALRFLGVAEIHALFACFPLFVAVLSVPLLNEAVGWRRWLAVLVGFFGTLIILQPGTELFNPYAILPLFAALLYALYNLLTRQVSKHDSFATSLVYFGIIGTVSSGVFAISQWEPVDSNASWLLLSLCATSVVGHIMLIKALQLTEAVVLQPFQYLILPWAVLIGYVAYGESLDPMTLLGASIVVGSGVYVAYREYVSVTST